MSDFHTYTVVKATKKRHNCEWCNVWIPAGSSCESQHGRYDCAMYRIWFHPECAAARDRDATLKDCEELYFPGECKRGKTYDETQDILEAESNGEYA